MTIRILRTPAAYVVLAGRVVEQGAAAATLLVFAAQTSPTGFGGVSLAFSFWSLASVAADYGASLAVLSVGGEAAAVAARTMRRRNGYLTLGGLVVGLAVAAVFGARPGAVVALAAAVWSATAWSSVGRSTAARRRFDKQVMAAESVGGACLLSIALAWSGSSAPVAAALAALLAKAIGEVVVLRLSVPSTEAVPASVDGASGAGWIWSAQLLAFAVANVDYLAALLFLGSTGLGHYALGFRIANLVPSLGSLVIVRVAGRALADRPEDARPAVAATLLRVGLGVGAVVAVLLFVAAPWLPDLLGDQWSPSVPVVQLLALSIPWRLALSVVGTTVLVAGRSRRLTRAEVVRLAVAATSLGVAAVVGLGTLSTVSSLLPIAGVIGMMAWPGRGLVLGGIRRLVPVALVCGVGTAILGVVQTW